MLPSRRQDALRLLYTARKDVHLCRDVEAYCHAVSHTVVDYGDHIRRAAHNLHHNAAVGREVVHASDDVLAVGTLVGRIHEQALVRSERFERMLQEKYDSLNDRQYGAMVRCRRCGSQEVTWEEKQTRSADEGATLFCACTTCKNRWVMR